MNEHIFCSRELTATSNISLEDALTHALHRAARSAKHLETIHILQKGRHLDENQMPQWQVTLHVGMSPAKHGSVLHA